MAQLEIGSVFADHRIEAVAGRGGMGVVYRAIQLDLERPVALKLITPGLTDDAAFRARFKREAQLAAAIDHPNILPVYQAGEVEGQLFLTMRFVPGTDLGKLIVQEERVEPGRAVQVIAQVAAALDAAHARGLVHRDVKPANILLSEDESEHVYLTDFGLTKHTTSTTELTKTGQFVGTLDYVSPEQIEGGKADARSDVYALGCVLFHALTGSRPYERDTEMAKMFAHVNDPIPAVTALVPGASPAADEVISRALAKAPADRYPSAGDLARAAASAFERPGPTIPERSVAAGPAAPGPTAPMDVPSDALTAETHAAAPEDEATVAQAPSGPQPPAAARAPAPPAGRPTTFRGGPPTRLIALAGAGAVALILAIVVLTSLLGGGNGGGEKKAAGGAPLPPAPVRTSGWQSLPDAPSARRFAATAVAGGGIWVMGGLTADGATRKVEVYDPATESWRAGPSLPLPLHHAMAIPYRGAPVVLGGLVPNTRPNGQGTGRSDLEATTSDKVFALRGGRWVALPPLPQPRAAGATSVVDDKVVAVGGRGADGKLLRSTAIFGGTAWVDGAPLPTAREDLAAATEGRFVYAAGGRDGSGESSGAFERFDPGAGSWQRLPALPTPRAGLGLAVVRNQVAAVGGAEQDRPQARVEAFDLVGEKWARLPNLPTPLLGPGVESYRRALYVATGATGAGRDSISANADVLRFASGRKPGR